MKGAYFKYHRIYLRLMAKSPNAELILYETDELTSLEINLKGSPEIC